MSEIAIMQALASALALPVDRALTEAVLAGMAPVLTEWSVNGGDDPRGALRFGTWTRDFAAAGEVMRALGQGACAGLHDRVPHQDLVGLGWAFSAQAGPRFRWWQLAPPGRGEALARAAAEASPALADVREVLAEVCGHDARCAAMGAEAEGEALVRTTIYYEVLSPAVAVRLLEIIGCAPSLPANLFFKGLLGLEPDRRVPWPKVWVGRSVADDSGDSDGGSAGHGSGWKLYYFARGDQARRSDRVLLDLAGASPGLMQAWQDMRRVLGCGEDQDVVQLLGLTFPDHAGSDGPAAMPRWTVYLAPR